MDPSVKNKSSFLRLCRFVDWHGFPPFINPHFQIAFWSLVDATLQLKGNLKIEEELKLSLSADSIPKCDDCLNGNCKQKHWADFLPVVGWKVLAAGKAGGGSLVLFSIKVSQEWSLGGIPLSSWTTQHTCLVAAKGLGSAVSQNFDERTSSLTFLIPSPCIWAISEDSALFLWYWNSGSKKQSF